MCLDDQTPPEEPERIKPDMMTDNRGQTYMAVRNCDLDRFSVK
jgi:hypothetical protein